MNREILFRGKRVDNGDWVYGYLTKLFGVLCIVDKINENFAYEVIPETVGQFTGLHDMTNLKDIFEGDILKIISLVKSEIIGQTCCFKSVEREDCAVVLQDNKTGGFKLKVYHKGKYKRIAKFAVGHLIVYKAEVIGNVYDNNELLK